MDVEAEVEAIRRRLEERANERHALEKERDQIKARQQLLLNQSTASKHTDDYEDDYEDDAYNSATFDEIGEESFRHQTATSSCMTVHTTD